MDDLLPMLIDRFRPAVEGDGGTIELLDTDESAGTVRISLTGSCVGCSTSTATLRVGIERIVRDHVPWVREVINVAGVDGASETAVSL